MSCVTVAVPEVALVPDRLVLGLLLAGLRLQLCLWPLSLMSVADVGLPGVAPPVEVSEVVVNESTPAEEEMCFGDKEVLANASAAVIGSPSAPRRTRASRSRRRKKVAAAPEAPTSVTSVPFAHVATTCFDVVRMAKEEEEVPDQHRHLRSDNEV